MLLDGQDHHVQITYRGKTKHIHIKGHYTAYCALARACMVFEQPDAKWVYNEAYLKIERTGETLENSLMMCETEVQENDNLILVDKEQE